MDNFYNSPALAQRLKSLKKTVLEPCFLVGKMSHRVKDKKLGKVEIVAEHSGPVSVLK
jgi:hypothetical protein